MSANKAIADRAEKVDRGKGGKGGKKNPASQLDGARDSEDEDVNDSYEDRLQKSLVDISNGKKKEGK